MSFCMHSRQKTLHFINHGDELGKNFPHSNCKLSVFAYHIVAKKLAILFPAQVVYEVSVGEGFAMVHVNGTFHQTMPTSAKDQPSFIRSLISA